MFLNNNSVFLFWKNYFHFGVKTLFNTFLILFLAILFFKFINWFLIDANWVANSSKECFSNNNGACWAFIIHKYRLILFGFYPYEEHWRPLIVIIILTGLIIISGISRFWNISLLVIWILGIIISLSIMRGGFFNLNIIETSEWGGLPVTLILSILGIFFSFPIGILLALGVNSDFLILKIICKIYIELIRSIPLISILFISSIIFSFFLDEDLSIDKFLRAQIVIIVFAAANVAETIRGGLKSVPINQYETSDSLGLSYWQKMRIIILPQALKIVISPIAGIFISLFKDTSLVIIIGVFDLTLAAKTSISDPYWQGLGIEAYIFIGTIYFLFCYTISKYFRTLENS